MEKRDVALAQIRRAIQLFRQADYICALTLAGAAEEVLGRIAQKRIGQTALDGELDAATGLAHLIGVTEPEAKHVRGVANRVRNALKHNDSGDNEWLEADFEFESQSMIDRALRNWLLAYGSFPSDRIVTAYHAQHWL